MEARLLSAALIAASLLSLGASHRTQNFIVTASSQDLAKEVGEMAEKYRRELAVEWLGSELPPWREPCPIQVQTAPHMGAGGATSFMFERGRPFGWRMSIQGSRQRVLDSVLPHEVTHTIFATHFGRPLPRWADEGACTTVEHDSEKTKQHKMLYQFLTNERGIAFNRMFAMKEYPRDVLPLYAQGFSLTRFLILHGGKRKFVEYVGEGMDSNNWTAATNRHYGYESLSDLQVTWLDWVREGSPNSIQPPAAMVAQQDAPADEQVASAQSPSGGESLAAVPQPSSKPDENEVAAASFESSAESESGSAGWYARVRDETKNSNTGAASNAADTGLQPNTPAPPPVEQSVTRPQPLGRPKQRILEWSRGNQSLASPPHSGTTLR